MNINKILGYILLVAGLLLMSASIYQSYNIFTGKASSPMLFKVQAPLPSKTGQATGQQDLQNQMSQEISKQLAGMIPADTLPKILNVSSWALLAALLIFGGAKIAGLGIKLIL